MNLQNGYKVIYEKTAEGKRTFYASKSVTFADAEFLTETELNKYKLVYEKDGRFYGSETGIPADGDYCFEAFDKVLKPEAATAVAETNVEEPAQTYSRRAPRNTAPVVEEPVSPEVTDTEE